MVNAASADTSEFLVQKKEIKLKNDEIDKLVSFDLCSLSNIDCCFYNNVDNIKLLDCLFCSCFDIFILCRLYYNYQDVI